MPKSHADRVKGPTINSNEKDSRGNQKLTFHIHLEFAHLTALSGHLGLQALDLFLALPDLHGEPDGHALGYNL